METTKRNKRRDRRSYTPELKSEIVDRCRAGDRSIPEVARDFDLTESAVRRWVAQAEIDAGEPVAGKWQVPVRFAHTQSTGRRHSCSNVDDVRLRIARLLSG